jgi:uncharacterized protein YbaR (Trm112 family)/2-polyprenyl-3-methyl-5-hydroxy-6-metoxy-1,4-benzoquinol methylase
MRPRLLDFLRCPIDGTPFELLEWESGPVTLREGALRRIERLGLDPRLFSREIITGVLVNRARRIYYPVHTGVPRLLVFPTAVARTFAQQHAARLAEELPGYSLPDEGAAPGEDTVLRTFSSEWVNYDWNSRAYWNVTAEAMYGVMRYMLDLGSRPVKDKVVLEVGVGIAGIADYMARTEECELVGMDLSHAVDPAYKHFRENPFLHLIQASVFAPPVTQATFDLVYSWGVLHHTYSTRAAFERISKLPKFGGRLYIWVYSHYDEQRTIGRRVLMFIERLVRPVLWRLPETVQGIFLLPFIPLYLLHQNLYVKRGGDGYTAYGWREAMHAARDRFTPRFVHRHSEDEVCGWFGAAGYEALARMSERERPDFVPVAFAACTAVEGVRRAL